MSESKNLLKTTSLGYKYNINPHVHGINITFETYLKYLKQEKIINSLKEILDKLGFSVEVTEDWLTVVAKDVDIPPLHFDEVISSIEEVS